MKKYKPLLKKIIIALVIVLSGFGIWIYLTSPGSARFLIDLRKTLAQSNLLLFCLAVVLYLLSMPLRALSWNAIFKAFDRAVPVVQLIPILMAGTFVNNITPLSRAGGEIVLIYGLRKKFRFPYMIAILSVVLGKLIELIPIGLMGVISILVLIQNRIISWQQLRLMGLMGGLLAGTVAWGIYKKRYLATLWSKFLSYFLRKELHINSSQLPIEEVNWSIKQKRGFGESLLFSSALWALALVRFKVLAYALGIELSFSAAAAAIVCYVVTGSFAFTPGGIGIIEGGLVAVLVLMGVSPSQAFALTVLERAISYFLGTALGAVGLFALGGKQVLANTKPCVPE